MNVLKSGEWCDLVHSRCVKGVVIDLRPHHSAPEQGLNFRSKYKFLFIVPVIERLDAETIASRKQTPGPLVPDGKCEHTVQPLERLSTPFPICIQQDLCVA